MDELISVIVPAYNVGPYLSNCLDSILAQSYQNIEIVIVDDGATDNSASIACAYQEQWPEKILFFHTENHGVTSARLTGVQAARGAWIGFVDGDDEIEPDMYERLYRNAQENNADISHCGHQTIVNGGERIHYFYNSGRFTVQDRESALRDLLLGTFEPGLWTKLFKRDLVTPLIEENTIDRSIKFNEDYLMNYFLFKKAEKTVFEDFCGYHYMARSDSATRSSFQIKRVLDPVLVNKTILDDVAPQLKDIAWHNYLACSLNAYLSLCDRPEYKEQADELRRTLADNWKRRGVLSRNERIKLTGALTLPGLFKRFYGFYEKRFQKKKYE